MSKKRKNKKRKQKSSILEPGLGFSLSDCITIIKGEPPAVDTHKMLWLYYTKKYAEVIQLIVNVSVEYEKFIFVKVQPKAQLRVDDFVYTALHILSRPDFVVPPESLNNLMAAGPIFNNLIQMSSMHNTDGMLRTILHQQHNFFKVISLCTARNNVQVDVVNLFDINSQLASVWWLQYVSGLAGFTNQLTYDNARKWLAEVPEKLILPDWRCTPLYFTATYIDPDKDRLIKKRMNEHIQDHLPKLEVRIKNTPKPKRIAIVAARWYTRSAVYKTSEPHIRALRNRGYDMDLIHLGGKIDDILLRDGFSNVKYVDIGKSGFDYTEIADNDYSAIYYTDIGMNNESIWMSNMRLAPIQIMGLGHPVSTFGSNIDYMISGNEVEHPDYVADNYSERVVLIPGLGATPVDPKYTLKGVKKSDSEFLINCCWTAQKINFPMLQALVEIKKRANKKVVYQFLPSWTIGRQNSAITFLRDVTALFGGDLRATLEVPYHEYLEKMEYGQLSLVPHPFGGYNTVVDSFAVGLPCVAIEGTKWFNRCAPGLMRRCGFGNLVVDSIESYVNKVVEIINNEQYHSELVKRLAEVDLNETLYATDEVEHFADAFDYILANHNQLQAEGNRDPIRIGR